MVTVLGAGSWGTALAQLVASHGHPVRLWGRNAGLVARMRETGTNLAFHEGIPLHPGISVTADLRGALDGSQVWINATPSYAARAIYPELASADTKRAYLVSTAKGIERESTLTLSQIAGEYFPQAFVRDRFSVLSGPSFAFDVIRGIPTAVTLACADTEASKSLAGYFHSKAFHVYFTTDVLGVEIAGGLKNVIAIAAGAIDGLAFGQSTRAALISRGIREISRIGIRMGASSQTFSGLAGLGDLIVTCTSDHSRNRRIGVCLAKGMTLRRAIATVGQVAEGIRTTRSAWELSQKLGANTPILEEIYRALYQGKPLLDAVESILEREAEAE